MATSEGEHISLQVFAKERNNLALMQSSGLCYHLLSTNAPTCNTKCSTALNGIIELLSMNIASRQTSIDDQTAKVL
jgi:hypothetical protein